MLLKVIIVLINEKSKNFTFNEVKRILKSIGSIEEILENKRMEI